MIILAIETSCDDTCIAILKSKMNGNNFEILSNIVSSQVKLHAKYGGVFPSLAKREHQKNLPMVLRKAVREAKNPKIDAIAATVGPGLEPCLWTGINFAKELAEKMNLPIVPVNHIEAHIIANFVRENPKSETRNPKLFPAVCLVVSGGHTQLILMTGIGKYRILGETRDDAAGECFDKIARILGLGYPGGPAIARYAAQWKFEIRSTKSEIRLPRPMLNTKDYDFSFSGLKTAVLYLVKNLKLEKKLTKKMVQEICFESQQSIIDVLIKKTMKAAKDYKAKTIILGGGVAANAELKKQFKEKIQREIPYSKFYIPDSQFCTDNAVMTATAAYFQWLRKKTKGWKKMIANANLRIDELRP
ncbi:MAG: tRNA (adenosine(37)-N6)-threonylcarbamoyltransferase complex transferase subunit TsaD [Patescibacteria group bacterium]